VEGPGADVLCAIREKVADRIGVNRYRTWFSGGTELQLAGQRLDVVVSNAFVGDWITSNYKSQLEEVTRDVLGMEPLVEIRIDPTRLERSADGAVRRGGNGYGTATAQPRPDEMPPPANPTFRRLTGRPHLRGELDSFVIGPCNELAFAVAAAVVRSPGVGFKHVLFHGGCGLGKTHLLQGVCNGLARAHPELQWCYLSAEEFTNEYIYALKAGRTDAFRARFRSADLLVIDDIHFLANKTATQAEFLHTFNAIDASGKTVALSSDCHPRQIKTLSEPLVNRLIAATVVPIHPPDFATRREILRRRAAGMLCELSDDVLDFVARHIPSNVRELEGALFKLVAYASLTKEPVRLDMVRRVVEEFMATAQPPRPADIQRLAALHFGVTAEALQSASRDRAVTLARAIAAYLIRKHTDMSFPEMGRAFGNKRHTTVLTAVRRIQTLADRDGAVAWKTSAGPREVPVRRLLEQLEQQLLRGPDRP
jgi:chromosomal replication initiator protein